MKQIFHVEEESTYWFEFQILQKAEAIIDKYYNSSEAYSELEALADMTRTGIRQLMRLVATAN